MQSNEEILHRYELIAHKQLADAMGRTCAEIRTSLHTPMRPMHAVLKLAFEALVAKLQVDDVLTVNWVSVKNNDYRKGLHDLVTYCIQTENDPALKPTTQEENQG